MPDFTGYLRSDGKVESLLDTDNQANSVAWMIDRNGESIVLVRANVAQTAQTVLLVPFGQGERPSESRSDTGETISYDVLLIGVRGHDTLTDFNVQRGDKFKYNSVWHEVLEVDKTLKGKTEARCVARG
jgi:hypothetical protein